MASAALLAMVTSCGKEVTEVSVSSELNVSTTDTAAESSESSVEASVDKVIATGIELVDYEGNMKGIKVYRDEREIDGMLYLPEGNGPFPVCFFAQGLGAPSIAYEDIASLQVKQTWHTERIGPRYSTRYREYYIYKIIVRTNKGKSVAISRSETDACYAVKAVHEHCLTHNPDVKLLDMEKSSMAPDKSSKQVVSGKGVRSSVDKAVSDQFLYP